MIDYLSSYLFSASSRQRCNCDRSSASSTDIFFIARRSRRALQHRPTSRIGSSPLPQPMCYPRQARCVNKSVRMSLDAWGASLLYGHGFHACPKGTFLNTPTTSAGASDRDALRRETLHSQHPVKTSLPRKVCVPLFAPSPLPRRQSENQLGLVAAL